MNLWKFLKENSHSDKKNRTKKTDENSTNQTTNLDSDMPTITPMRKLKHKNPDTAFKYLHKKTDKNLTHETIDCDSDMPTIRPIRKRKRRHLSMKTNKISSLPATEKSEKNEENRRNQTFLLTQIQKISIMSAQFLES